MLYFFVSLIGVFISMMIAFNGLLGRHLTAFEVSLVVHIIGLICLLAVMAYKRQGVVFWGIPKWFYLSGVLGALLTAFDAYGAVLIGVTLYITLSTFAQIVSSIAFDAVGVGHLKKVDFNRVRLFSIGLLVIGVGLMLWANFSSAHVLGYNGLAILLGLLSGVVIVFSKYISNAAARHLGLLKGTLINYIVGSLFALLLALVFGGGQLALVKLPQIPWYYYLSGVFGVLAMMISNATLNKLPILHSTSLIITLQMLTALALDYLLFQQFTPLKALGGAVVIVALLLDQRLIKRKHN